MDRRLFFAVKKCQETLAEWIVPDSTLSDKACLEKLVGFLDDQELVRRMQDLQNQTVHTVRDCDCPECNYPEMIWIRDRATMEPIYEECGKACGYTKEIITE